MTPERIAHAFVTACLTELDALKPGNVHRHAGGHGMSVADFERSAEAAAPAIAAPASGVGARVLKAVEGTRAAVGQNTNLGILLLCAPLAAAAECGQPIAAVLAGLSVEDAVAAFAAIRLAGPGGLGRSGEADVAQAPTITLLAAMRLAQDRDRIAWNYANGFADILQASPHAEALAARGWPEPWIATALHLRFLAAFPDTHIERKWGRAAAEAVRAEAVGHERALIAAAEPAARHADLLAFDSSLKERGLNPGTSADLTVAVLFARGLGAGGGVP